MGKPALLQVRAGLVPLGAWRMTGLLPMRKPGFELLRLTLRASAQQAMDCHRFQATPVANAQNRC